MSGSQLYAAVCRRLADEPVVGEIAPDARWDVPIKVLGALHYRALEHGIDPWDRPGETLAEHAEWVARFVAEQRVQTNEVQRSWGLLPAFLSFGDRPLELLELGPSAGLNLVWDRYRCLYGAGSWGPADASLVLSGDERSPVPASLLAGRPEIVRRRGIDLDPVDVTTVEGARLLECFVWADRPERLERLRHAMSLLREDPPELVRGDYVDLLPAALADRIDGVLLVVFQTASIAYLPRERYLQLRETLEHAPGGQIAWISSRRHDDEDSHVRGGWELEVALWPEQRPRVAARMGYHGQWLEWLG